MKILILIIIHLVAYAYSDCQCFNNFWKQNINLNADDLYELKENNLKKDQEIKKITEKNQILEEKTKKLEGIVNTMQVCFSYSPQATVT